MRDTVGSLLGALKLEGSDHDENVRQALRELIAGRAQVAALSAVCERALGVRSADSIEMELWGLERDARRALSPPAPKPDPWCSCERWTKPNEVCEMHGTVGPSDLKAHELEPWAVRFLAAGWFPPDARARVRDAIQAFKRHGLDAELDEALAMLDGVKP